MKLLLGGGRCGAANNRAIAVVGGVDFLEGSTDKDGRKKLRGFFFFFQVEEVSNPTKISRTCVFFSVRNVFTSVSILLAPLFLSHKEILLFIEPNCHLFPFPYTSKKKSEKSLIARYTDPRNKSHTHTHEARNNNYNG
jgi:hypothetical protein